MPNVLLNLSNGVIHRLKKMFYRPFSTFNIGWAKEKILKHQTSDTSLKYHLYKKKYKVAFRDAPTFLMSIEELFINEFYKFRTTNARPKIIDCGSYIGTSILYFKVNYPNSIVTGFEPDNSNYSILKQNLDSWNFSDTNVVNAAIWTSNGNISFNSAGNMSSRIETGEDGVIEKNNVRCLRLNDLLNEEIDFLKIDIEGAELPVLKDCSDNLRNVKNLFVEYHGKYDEMFKLNEILEILVQNDFKYYIKEGNVVYAKPFWDKEKIGDYDMLLNIFAFRE
ncbi:MAG TPA: FkbM family methyltransferase [Hanamia sp.]|nr:FkbM family methyltransferase [Hanamia sp.]